MYTLYIANKNYSSWSLRPWILLKELNIPFEERLHRFEAGGAWATFRSFSPTGKVPALHDGKTVVWDSLAITEYLHEPYRSVWAADSAARAWSRSASAEMHSAFGTLRQQCSFNLGLRVKLREISEPLQKEISRMDELWTDGLTRFGGPYLAGPQFTAVDAFFAPIHFRIQTYGLRLSPKAMTYSKAVLGLSGMRSWYEGGLAETFRDPEHDDVILKFGDIVEDFRAKAG